MDAMWLSMEAFALTTLYSMQSSGRLATTRLSWLLSVPAAVFRGLANGGLSAAIWAAFNASNPAHGKKISPRISNASGADSFS